MESGKWQHRSTSVVPAPAAKPGLIKLGLQKSQCYCQSVDYNAVVAPGMYAFARGLQYTAVLSVVTLIVIRYDITAYCMYCSPMPSQAFHLHPNWKRVVL